ncbi:MAG: MepB family protein [Bacteroidota bacterium]
MTTDSQLSLLYPDLLMAKIKVYDKCNFHFSNPVINTEGSAYHACSFELNGKIVQYRGANITPKKEGQFVAIWKRNNAGITEPFDVSDNMDYLIITVRNNDHFGQFIFPKIVLADKGIITRNGKEGKRGIRVYPPWDMTQNKQAEKTQRWQTLYFLPIPAHKNVDLDLARKLFV